MMSTFVEFVLYNGQAVLSRPIISNRVSYGMHEESWHSFVGKSATIHAKHDARSVTQNIQLVQ